MTSVTLTTIRPAGRVGREHEVTDDGAVDRLRIMLDSGPIWPPVVPVLRRAARLGRGQPPSLGLRCAIQDA
jgi:hypothetical protein